ncbi:molybdenum cofactor guanylyltransferase [Salibacterium salarium]|uniref:Molybdenum cofactor guanylyltransferase n=1 Tax=Salibacterium salarium TaxID=284579 RepID=A0A3R9WTP4_9BACI|nr:molybdenum cofactor guanylyltransferase [Salibacterium salarium]RSL33366.1 molybdenum cofactor guanylyltransferase [Salibacterium salarium]
MDTAGVVLAGGKSSRYGKQKILETHHGIPFYEHSIRAFTQGGISSVYVVTNNELSGFLCLSGIPLIIEETMHEGPLYALATAMRTLQETEWIFLLPADVPYVQPSFIETMADVITHARKEVDAFIPITGGKQQPLHGVYHRRSLHVIEDLLNQNYKSMKPLIAALHVHFQPFPQNQLDFININHAEDWPY